MSLLAVSGLRKTFGALEALAGVDLKVDHGQIVMIIGPNGSGKTTLINAITGIYKPDAGRVLFNGTEIQSLPPHKIYELGLVRTFQIPLPFARLTVLENVLAAYRGNLGENFLSATVKSRWEQHEEKITEDAFTILGRLTLDHLWNEKASNLSGGQFKLLEIGRALASGARMILMDEPVSGVNPVLAHQVLKHIVSLRDQLGIAFLLVEHRLDLVLPYVDYVYAMDRGRVISQGETDKVVNDPTVVESYLGG